MRRPTATLVLGAAAFAVLAVAWRLGWLVPVELAVRDVYLRWQPLPPAETARVAVVRIEERDIEKYGHPLPDGLLADLVERLLDASPRALGIDVYRDRRVGEGGDRLRDLVLEDSRIVMIEKVPDEFGPGIVPPDFLRNERDRVGFVDLVLDRDGVPRRALLFLWDEQGRAFVSFSLRLALLHLRAEGLGTVPDPERPEWVRLGTTTLPPLESNHGGYVGVDADGYQVLLDYHRRPEEIPAFGVSDLLDGRIPEDALRDRVVILGTTASSVKDHFHTPFGARPDGGVSFGVELHALAVDQLLRSALEGDAPPKSLSEPLEALWLLLVALVSAGLGLGVRSIPGFGSALAAVLFVPLAIEFGALAAGWWLPGGGAALAALLALGLGVAFATTQARAERAQIMQLFGRFVSRDVARRIWEDREEFLEDGRPRPQRLVATVLLTDLQGYTSAAEKLEPSILMSWMNDYMETMARTVEAHGGIVDDYAGDGLKADFGIPVSRSTPALVEADASAAVRCALAMREAFADLNRQWAKRGLPTARMRVGISTGTVVVGSLGSSNRLKYTTIGDTVNVASRLESFRKEESDGEGEVCRILIAGGTRDGLGEQFQLEHLGDHALKGREEKTTIYRVLGEQREETGR